MALQVAPLISQPPGNLIPGHGGGRSSLGSGERHWASAALPSELCCFGCLKCPFHGDIDIDIDMNMI